MMTTVLLVCALAVPPQECTRATALDVAIAAPTATATMCGLGGQAAIAPTAIRPEPGVSYLKILCERRRDDALAR